MTKILNQNAIHSFHIPVMGLAFTIDTPLKVAKFGISSAVSIMEDGLIEEMRRLHSKNYQKPFNPIPDDDVDRRYKRIKAYLDLLNTIVSEQLEELKKLDFSENSELTKYFVLLPENSPLKLLYKKMLFAHDSNKKKELQKELRASIKAGDIDVNIMTKVDNINLDDQGIPLPEMYSDAKSALKGFALSSLSSSVIFSAGLNPKLFSFCESFDDFYPNSKGEIKKRIILKVSDYRSAKVQGKFFAKKGILISEFRIESGLNCGGHAFATNGFLMGPILQEFKEKRQELYDELFQLCSEELHKRGKHQMVDSSPFLIKAQGGIGTYHEHEFLIEHYSLSGTGWGSPFLMVPETTNVDEQTLKELVVSERKDFYLSNSSPLGVPFNNFRKSTSDVLRLERIAKNRTGSPCYKKYLASNTEFTSTPICTASRQYQYLKSTEIMESELPQETKHKQIQIVQQKECLCEGLITTALLKNKLKLSHNLKAVSICPGPNLAYFRGVYNLKEMIDHIYGRSNLLILVNRPNMFYNEALLYVEYLKKEIDSNAEAMTDKLHEFYQEFKNNLEKGIDYYTQLFSSLKDNSKEIDFAFSPSLFQALKLKLDEIVI